MKQKEKLITAGEELHKFDSIGFFIIIYLLIQEGSHREIYQEFQPSYDNFRMVFQTTGPLHPKQPTLLNC